MDTREQADINGYDKFSADTIKRAVETIQKQMMSDLGGAGIPPGLSTDTLNGALNSFTEDNISSLSAERVFKFLDEIVTECKNASFDIEGHLVTASQAKIDTTKIPLTKLVIIVPLTRMLRTFGADFDRDKAKTFFNELSRFVEIFKKHFRELLKNWSAAN